MNDTKTPRFLTSAALGRILGVPDSTTRGRLRSARHDGVLLIPSGAATRQIPVFAEDRLPELRSLVTGLPLVSTAE